jgi:hypothetical protein
VQSLKDLAATAEVKARVTELYDVILAGQQAALQSTVQQQAHLERIRELEEELRNIKTWETTKERYKLASIAGGSFVYALKSDANPPEPAHWICPQCYEDSRKSILICGRAMMRTIEVSCSHCEYKFIVPGSQLIPEYAK